MHEFRLQGSNPAHAKPTEQRWLIARVHVGHDQKVIVVIEFEALELEHTRSTGVGHDIRDTDILARAQSPGSITPKRQPSAAPSARYGRVLGAGQERDPAVGQGDGIGEPKPDPRDGPERYWRTRVGSESGRRRRARPTAARARNPRSRRRPRARPGRPVAALEQAQGPIDSNRPFDVELGPGERSAATQLRVEIAGSVDPDLVNGRDHDQALARANRSRAGARTEREQATVGQAHAGLGDRA